MRSILPTGSIRRQLQNSRPVRHSVEWAFQALVGVVVVGIACLACAQAGPTANRRQQRREAASPQSATTPAAQAPDPAPSPLVPAAASAEAPAPAPIQAPAHPPKVSWNGKELTVDADNSSLMEILMAVRTKTGALVDVPDSASNERVAVHIGPAPIRNVHDTLLYGTNFDYVIQATDDGAGLRSLALTTRGGKDGDVAVPVADKPDQPGVRRMKGFGSSGKTTFQAAAEAALAEQASAEKPSKADSASSAEGATPAQDPPPAGPESASNGPPGANPTPAGDPDSNAAPSSDGGSSPTVHPGAAGSSAESTPGDTSSGRSTDDQHHEQPRQIQLQQTPATGKPSN